MDSITPPQCPNTVTVRRNPPRRARPTPMKYPAPINMEELLPNPQPDPPSSSAAQAPAPDSLKVFLRIKPVVRVNATAASKLLAASKLRTKNAWPQNPTAKKNSTKEKPVSEVCISMNDCQSVTISPPPSLVESKKIKSEIYEGFSHVFAPDSLQSEVYDKMVKPMVDDFLQGRNGMLAALGPSGSGKTHTVFGTSREPGMVPLALQHIFKQSKGSDRNLSRSFFLSIFEIYSEKGRGERICDLIPERVQSGLRTSAKGVQEVIIPNASKAESLIACAMLKRATSMTNTNSQSSRSQCIINVRMLVEKQDGELGGQPCDVMLTIVDLAGAEREKKTGNQGAKLLESNFINNTSMVFGLCLRALLEHQKNPKKQLQMHYQNSLLTRYLREYLEGKKRMNLILTVKPGEEDYLDTSYLLRQASPYMKIKFNNLDDTSGLVRKRRPVQFLSKVGQDKRLKPSDVDVQPEQRKANGPENLTLQEDPTNEAPTIDNSDSVITSPIHFNSTESLTTDRSHTIMKNFAKAIWSVLKQYKERLVLVEREVQNVSENLVNEKARRIELEKELLDLKSRCACFKKNKVEATLLKVNTKIEVHENLADNDADESQGVLKSNSGRSSRMAEPFLEQIQQDVGIFPEINANTGSTCEADECCSSWSELDINVVKEEDLIEEQVRSTSGELGNDKADPVDIQSVVHGEENVDLQLSPACQDENEQSSVQATSFIEDQVQSTSGDPRSNRKECLNLTEELQSVVHGEERDDLQRSPARYRGNEQSSVQATSVIEVQVQSTSGDSRNSRTESFNLMEELVDIQPVVHGEEYVDLQPCPARYEENEQSSVQAASVIEDQVQSTSGDPRNNRLECLDLTEELVDIQSGVHAEEHVDLQQRPALFKEDEKSSVQATMERHQSGRLEKFQGPSDPPESKEDDVRCTQDSNCKEPLKDKTKSVPPLKPSKPEKPKRRLLPASSSLLRDITTLAINDEPEKTKRGKGGKKLGVDETKRTQGNNSLLRLLQSFGSAVPNIS